MDFFFVLLLSEITCLSIISLVIFLKWIICSFGYEYCFVFWQIPSETLPGSSERSVTLAGSPDALGSCVAKICDIFEEVSLVFCLFVCLFVYYMTWLFNFITYSHYSVILSPICLIVWSSQIFITKYDGLHYTKSEVFH